MNHITVLKTEAVDVLALTQRARVVDCTLGAGGHSRLILSKLDKTGILVSLDADETAIAAFEAPTSVATHHLAVANFKDLPALSEQYVVSSYDAILADLGWHSDQFTDGNKGFSFLQNEPLLMTYGDPSSYPFTANDIINDWDEESIADIIFGYGEERGARLIAAAIVEARKTAPIVDTKTLADLIEATVGHFYKRMRIHPATKTFQALRITVNDELGVLKNLLEDGFNLLAPGGRLAIISFHSLEDRLVKQSFRQRAHDHTGLVVTKKPIIATDEEIAANPRARSAKLRCIEKI